MRWGYYDIHGNKYSSESYDKIAEDNLRGYSNNLYKITWYGGYEFPYGFHSEQGRRHRHPMLMEEARLKKEKEDEWSRIHDYRDVRKRMCLSHHLECAHFGDNEDITSLICRVRNVNNTGDEWPSFTREDFDVLAKQRSRELLKIADHYNMMGDGSHTQSGQEIAYKYIDPGEAIEEARQKQEIAKQERQKRKTKFVSAVRSKPRNDVAQGPNEGTGFLTHRRPASTELKLLKKTVQRSVTKESLTLEQYEDSLQNPTGRAAQGKKIYPPDENFIHNTGCHVTHSPSCFATSLLKRTTRQERTRQIKPARAGRKSTFTFPANTVQPARKQPTYTWGTRWANAESNDNDSDSSLAEEETNEAEQERRHQSWLRDTSLESRLNVGAGQFHPAHPPSTPLVPKSTPNDEIAGGLIHQDGIDARLCAMQATFDTRLCAMEATNYLASQNMMGQLKACLLDIQSILIVVIKDHDSLSAVTLHSAIYALEHKLTDTINSVLLPDANKPASSSVPDNTDADAMCPTQGHKKKKRRKKRKKKSKISTQEIEAEPTSHPAHEAVENATSESTSLIVRTSLSPCTPSDVLSEETVLNSSVDLAVSKATLATDVSKESYLVKLSLEGDPSKPLTAEKIPANLLPLEIKRQKCNRAIDAINWKYPAEESCQRPNKDKYCKDLKILRHEFQTFDPTCSHLTVQWPWIKNEYLRMNMDYDCVGKENDNIG